MSRHSRLTRLLRSLTALVTVWCLGCNAFDPLIGSLFPDGAGPLMVCASEAPTTGPSLHDNGEVPSVSAVADQGNRGASCDCGTCYAPAPTALAVAAMPGAVPHQPAPEPSLAPSVARAPLDPPPQLGA